MGALRCSTAFSSSSVADIRSESRRYRTVDGRFMASSSPVEQVNPSPTQSSTGDSFIRLHLRKLSPYQPILPFEVRIWRRQNSSNPFDFLLSCKVLALILIVKRIVYFQYPKWEVCLGCVKRGSIN